MIRFVLIALVTMILLISCRTAYAAPELPDYEGGRIDYKSYDMESLEDMWTVIQLQKTALDGWERFYGRLRAEYAR